MRVHGSWFKDTATKYRVQVGENRYNLNPRLKLEFQKMQEIEKQAKVYSNHLH